MIVVIKMVKVLVLHMLMMQVMVLILMETLTGFVQVLKLWRIVLLSQNILICDPHQLKMRMMLQWMRQTLVASFLTALALVTTILAVDVVCLEII